MSDTTRTTRATIAVRKGPEHARIMGIGAYRPDRVVTNDDICEFIDSSDEWIRERTGIISRRFAAPGESVLDMAAAASGKALAQAGISPGQVDCVLVATISYLKQTPAAAVVLAERLGVPHGAATLDISAACAGFGYGVSLAADAIRGGNACHVLLVGVEKMTDIVAPDDRGASFIFADGAGAVVIGPSDVPAIGPTVWGSDGSQADAIAQPADWAALNTTEHIDFPYLRMQGQSVFRWTVSQIPAVAQEALSVAGITADDLDVFIPHQANNRITDAIVKKLGFPDSVGVSRDIVTTGNTSAASIPLAMAAMLESGEASSGDLALLVGFGAGLTYAAQVVVLP